jgi:PAS domain S-box-containing protein
MGKQLRIRFFANKSIKGKLTWVIMVTSSIALLLACLAFILIDRVTFKKKMVRDLCVLSEIVADNSTAALAFNDVHDAENVLGALQAEPHIVIANIYGWDSQLFASYHRDSVVSDSLIDIPPEKNYCFHHNHLCLSQPIELDGEQIGIIYIQSDLRELSSRMAHYAEIMFAVLLVSLLAAILVMSKLQKVVTEPIFHLTRVTREVSERKDYSRRAVKKSNDELGFLIERFNEMLTQIQERDTALQQAHDELELRVKERTKELEQEISERRQAEEALSTSEEKYRSLVENLGEGITSTDEEDRFTFANPAAEEIFGVPTGSLTGRNVLDFVEQDGKEIIKQQNYRRRSGRRDTYELTIVRPDGKKRQIRVSVSPRFGSQGHYEGSFAIITDISGYRELELQLRESQKMEAIGTLAGGVAHDFNNLLTAIIGHLELAMSTVEAGSPLKTDLEEISKASERATNLTRQLLAFGRRQTMELKILNLNSVIANMEKMLQRIIGEDIELVTLPHSDLWKVKVDPGQVEQVIVNLVVNARDAMPNGGRLSIETGNIRLDDLYCEAHANVAPGDYVMLAVSDTGCGISKDVINRIFDPFFTTKEVGKGTGLGLSTVYGIVKQSNGHINVYSESNQGSTFKVYLPRVEGSELAFSRNAQLNATEMPRGNETILLVEDEDVVRELTVRMLERQGYHVLKASCGDEAYQICLHLGKPVDLVITDVIMPNMGGAELSHRLRELWHDVKVLYMSGYTANSIAHHGVLDSDKAYLQKPFRVATLAQKVREVLDGTAVKCN